MDKLDREELRKAVQQAAAAAHIQGELTIEEYAHTDAPFGPYAHRDVCVKSTEPNSCPITLSLFEEGNADGYVTISFGSSYYEAWFLSAPETLAVVRRFLIAIMQGRYEEWREAGEGDRAYGLLVDEAGSVLYSDIERTSREKLVKRGFEHKKFSRY